MFSADNGPTNEQTFRITTTSNRKQRDPIQWNKMDHSNGENYLLSGPNANTKYMAMIITPARLPSNKKSTKKFDTGLINDPSILRSTSLIF
jgi:hypothetical protein